MKKIITFLGERGALQTTYTHNGNSYIGGVFAEALRQFCDYDEMLVCVTEKAKANTWSVLENLEDPRIKLIDIPTGTDTNEMWQTFKIISDCVDENDEVIFDITHGLRSLPFLVFLFASYLKAAKKVTIRAIYYGALELGNSRNGIPAPVIDLSEFVGMLDWLTATNRFVENGDGKALAELLQKAIPSKDELKNDPSTRPIRDNLKQAAEAIENISLALNITRPIETLESAANLEEILSKAQPSFEQRAKPFTLLNQTVIHEYGRFALKNSTQEAVLTKNIDLQLEMIKSYLTQDKVVQSLTLAREWLVSVLALRFGIQNIFDDRMPRKPVETALNNAAEKKRQSPRQITPGECDEQFEALPEADELIDIWNQITELRNDIAHCGMRKEAQKAKRLKEKAESVVEKLQPLAQKLLPNLDKIER